MGTYCLSCALLMFSQFSVSLLTVYGIFYDIWIFKLSCNQSKKFEKIDSHCEKPKCIILRFPLYILAFAGQLVVSRSKRDHLNACNLHRPIECDTSASAYTFLYFLKPCLCWVKQTCGSATHHTNTNTQASRQCQSGRPGTSLPVSWPQSHRQAQTRSATPVLYQQNCLCYFSDSWSRRNDNGL